MDASIVDAIASGAEIRPSEGGKYPGKNKATPKIAIPQPHFDIKKTAIGTRILRKINSRRSKTYFFTFF